MRSPHPRFKYPNPQPLPFREGECTSESARHIGKVVLFYVSLPFPLGKGLGVRPMITGGEQVGHWVRDAAKM